MEIGLLGPLSVARAAEALALGGPRQRTVLAHLILRANREVSKEQLIDLVWGEDPPATARGSLQSYVSRLRAALGPDRLEGHGGRYLLRAAAEEVDALRFESLVGEARRNVVASPSTAAQAYRAALNLWRGAALEDLADEPSLLAERVRLDELRVAAIEELMAVEIALGRNRGVVGQLQSLVEQHPFREQLWGLLMVALYRSGRQREALDAYQRLRRTLADELGVDPWPRLRRLHDQIVRQDAELEFCGQPVRGYRLLERVGEGTFGAVHRAFQPGVGREVAIKVIRPGLANDPEFIRRFAAEAELAARLEHPHVVPLHDYWREPDGAFLVMRYLRGGSLRKALADGAASPDSVVRLVEQIGGALSFAHRQGVVHRDVKPANILFDEEGNAYLSDFGIATELARGDREPLGLPSRLTAYLSPEASGGGPVDARADIYSLGVVIFEALTGCHPLADSSSDPLAEHHAGRCLPSVRTWQPELPGAVDDVIARATATDPAERPGDAVVLAEELRAALSPLTGGAHLPVEPVEARKPYKGLRAFLEADAEDFHGRKRLVDDLVSHLRADSDARFLAVVGPSGSGKSSLVRAGLLPALRRGAVPGSAAWFVVEMYPGAHPFEELAAALTRVAAAPRPGLVDQLQEADTGLLDVVAGVLPAPEAELLLVVDQFEEVFTLVADDGLRARFLAAIATAATDPRSRVRVVVTLRADFYDLPLADPAIAELIAAGTFSLTPLTPGELERAIAGPAEAVGVSVEPALVAALVADVADQAASLPSLQYALTEVFERRNGGGLTLAAYDEVGGVSGALAARAEELYARLPPAGQVAARQLFLRLVTISSDGAGDLRRREGLAELNGLEVEPEAMAAAVDAFGARRLLTFDRDPVTRGPTVEVAHEALLREWSRLRGWIDAARGDVLTHHRLAADTREWVEAGRDDSVLLRGDRLRRFESWAETSGLALTGIERAFLTASVARREAELFREQEREARERALERRSLVRLRVTVAVVGLFALVTSVLTVVTLDQWRGAQAKARIATARELAAAALAELEQDPELSTLLALEAVEQTRADDGVVLREAEEALHRAVKSLRVVRTLPQGGFGVAVSSDGRRVVTIGDGQSGTATVWDLETGTRLATLEGPGGVAHVALSPDDDVAATAHGDGTVRLWDVASGRELRMLGRGGAFVAGVAFSPDGRRLAAGRGDGRLDVRRVADGRLTTSIPTGDVPIFSVDFSPDGSRVVTGDDLGRVRIWDVGAGRAVATLEPHEWPAASVDFSRDGRWVASSGYDARIHISDARTGALVRTIAGSAPFQSVAFSPDGSRVLTGSSDAVAAVWDVETGRELVRMVGHRGGPIGQAVFLPDGDRVVTTGVDGTTRLWDVSASGARDWLTVPGVRQILAGVSFSPDGRTFAAPAHPSGVSVWDTRTGAELRRLSGSRSKQTTVAFSPDGSRIVATSDVEPAPPVWDVRTGRLLFRLEGQGGYIRAAAFSPDGERILTTSSTGARVWDAATGNPVRDLPEVDNDSLAVGYSSDGRTLAVGSGNSVHLYDAASLRHLSTLQGHSGNVTGMAWQGTGTLVTTAEDGTAKVWDVASGEERLTFRGHRGPVNQVAIAPSGDLVATTGEDATTRLWELDSGREILALESHDSLAYGVDFSPDGRLLATASPDGTVALHLLPVDELVELARERVTRGLTDEECREYLHVTPCPQHRGQA